MGGSHSDVSKHVKAYFMVFGALAVFTVLTVLASYVHVSTPMHVGIALLIASIKASLVAAIFMHLKWERGASIWVTLVFCAIFFIVLMVIPAAWAADQIPETHHSTWTAVTNTPPAKTGH